MKLYCYENRYKVCLKLKRHVRYKYLYIVTGLSRDISEHTCYICVILILANRSVGNLNLAFCFLYSGLTLN